MAKLIISNKEGTKQILIDEKSVRDAVQAVESLGPGDTAVVVAAQGDLVLHPFMVWSMGEPLQIANNQAFFVVREFGRSLARFGMKVEVIKK